MKSYAFNNGGLEIISHCNNSTIGEFVLLGQTITKQEEKYWHILCPQPQGPNTLVKLVRVGYHSIDISGGREKVTSAFVK